MIDPSDVTKFDRTDAELEEWWLFSTVVAGKTAATQARLLDYFLKAAGREGETPFQTISALPIGMIPITTLHVHAEPTVPYDPLLSYMKQARLGQYRRLVRCWRESLTLDLRNDPVEAFEAIHGIGPKTARMFMMHSRPNQRLAALDTHVLKHLAANGHTVPKVTPSSVKDYHRLEQAFLALADAAGQSPADYDLAVWKSYATRPPQQGV